MDDLSLLLAGIVLFICSIAVCVAITRWVFKIDTMAYYSESQAKTLIEILSELRTQTDILKRKS